MDLGNSESLITQWLFLWNKYKREMKWKLNVIEKEVNFC